MTRMPALFLGHGSPMNAIEQNVFSESWIELGKTLPKPKAILSVSAHWFTDGTRINDAPVPEMIYDMYGFPDELYRVQYPATGSPEVAREAARLLGDSVIVDNNWGLDHGSWSVLRRLYPKADVPVFQLSVNANATMRQHFSLGNALRSLREEGVLILGSGNVVHNLSRLEWTRSGGFDWAAAFDAYVKEHILSRTFESVQEYKSAGESARLSVPTPDHFAPLLYVLGASDPDDTLNVFNEACVFGTISMTGYLFAEKDR